MNRYAQQKPPKWWAPKLSPFWLRIWRPLRKRRQYHEQKLMEIEVRGLENIRGALDAGNGVMINPNHSGHADAHIMYHAADELGMPFYFMSAWQVFYKQGFFGKLILQHHGCFSVDREGTDMKAFRQATSILQDKQNPMVIFPEGEVYHINERVTPFREGAAAIALTAARRADRDVVCIPCGVKYQYLEDPTENMLALMDRLEQGIFWRPRRELALHERIYRFAEGAMALKELEHMGRTSAGPLPERIDVLAKHVLDQLEEKHELVGADKTIPERVKEIRRQVQNKLHEMSEDVLERGPLEHDLDDVFLVLQLFSYPGDYVKERPTIERMAETLDKFEEDVLGVYTATIRGERKATVAFGEPIPVTKDRKRKSAAQDLTAAMEAGVQAMLDSIEIPQDRF